MSGPIVSAILAFLNVIVMNQLALECIRWQNSAHFLLLFHVPILAACLSLSMNLHAVKVSFALPYNIGMSVSLLELSFAAIAV